MQIMSRRSILASAAVTSGFCVARAASPPALRFSDLYVRQGDFPQPLVNLVGQQVTMQGFMAPPLKAEASFFVLTKMPMATCPFCSAELEWPDDIVVVIVKGGFVPLDFNLVIDVKGQLQLGSQTDADTGFVSRVRIINASFRRIRL